MIMCLLLLRQHISAWVKQVCAMRCKIDGRCPFGFSAERENPNRNAGESYAYNISPGMLVAYKKGNLQCMRESDVVRILKDAAKSIAL